MTSTSTLRPSPSDKLSPWSSPQAWNRWFSKRLLAVCVILFGIYALSPEAQRNFSRRSLPRDYFVYYGGWDQAKIEQAWAFRLAIVHPGNGFDNLPGDTLRRLQAGADGELETPDDLLVLGYISLGELASVPQSVAGVYPDHFLDRRSYLFDRLGPRRGLDGKPLTVAGQDGLPDENGVWGSYYVDARSRDWQEMVLDRARQLAEKGFDGFFLDTLDTASPFGHYADTKIGLSELIGRFRREHPDRLLVGNRGFFLLQDAGVRVALDGVMFESFTTEWDWVNSRAQENPWLGQNLTLLRETIRPDSNLAVLALDYLDPEQPDAPVYLHTRNELLDGQRVYASHPWLDRFYPRTDELFPRGGDQLEPPYLEAREAAPGLVEVNFPEGADVRFARAGSPLPTAAWPRAQPRTYLKPDGGQVVFRARRVGPRRGNLSDWVEQKLVLSHHPGSQVKDLTGESGDGRIHLTWKGEGPFRIFQFQQQVATSSQPAWTSPPLETGKSYQYTVTVEDGPPVAPITVTCRRVTFLPPPEVVIENDLATWSEVEGATGYRVYRIPLDQRWQLGQRLLANVRRADLKSDAPYRLVVTSVDGAGVESHYPPGLLVDPASPERPTPFPTPIALETDQEPGPPGEPDRWPLEPDEGWVGPRLPSSDEPTDSAPPRLSVPTNSSESISETESEPVVQATRVPLSELLPEPEE